MSHDGQDRCAGAMDAHNAACQMHGSLSRHCSTAFRAMVTTCAPGVKVPSTSALLLEAAGPERVSLRRFLEVTLCLAGMPTQDPFFDAIVRDRVTRGHPLPSSKQMHRELLGATSRHRMRV